MQDMKTLTINGTTYNIVDATAREMISEMPTTEEVVEAVLDAIPAAEGVSY